MNTQLLGTLRLTIIDELRAEIREREGVIADLTRDEERDGPVLAFMPSTGSTELTPRPVHGDAIAKVRAGGKLPTTGAELRKELKLAKIKALRGKYKTTPEDLREPMIAFVKKNPGCKAEQIREAIGAKPTQMPTLRALTSHAVKTKGAKRATTYWPRGGAK